MRASVLFAFLLFASPALAQDAPEADARRRVLELRAELDTIDTEGPDFATEMGAHLVVIGVAYTLVGSLIEVISQETSARWRFVDPPWFVIAGAGIGALLGAIGTPLLVWGISDGRHRRRRELQEEIERLEGPTATLRPIGPGAVGLWVAGTF